MPAAAVAVEPATGVRHERRRFRWDICMLVASQQPVELLSDADHYHYLTETYQGTDFASSL